MKNKELQREATNYDILSACQTKLHARETKLSVQNLGPRWQKSSRVESLQKQTFVSQVSELIPEPYLKKLIDNKKQAQLQPKVAITSILIDKSQAYKVPTVIPK